MNNESPWLRQALRIVIAAEWGALALGTIAAVTTANVAGALVLAAVALGAVFVGVSTFVPADALLERGLALDILVVAGAVLTIASATLNGGLARPFLLLALTPTLLASVTGGTRMGVTTSLLSSGLLTGVTVVALDIPAVAEEAGAIALFPLLALLVGQIRNLLVESEQRAATLEAASVRNEAEMARLSQANDLLRRLTDVYADGGANPVEVGRSTLEAIVDAHPGAFATATLFDAAGPVVIARMGTDSPDLQRSQIPLGDGETTTGVVSIGTPRRLTPEEKADIDRMLRPVAVSFANTMLLQDIAGAAVKEERLRLARELHDEVGPALAALGLSLDLVSMHTVSPEVTEGVADVRTSLGTIVDDIRSIIADLRAESTGSLTAHLHALAGTLQAPPRVLIDLDERRPPRAAVARQIEAIVTESIRNAYRHADANTVTVRGAVDRGSVEVEIGDDGSGFIPESVPEGHYGLMGMRERADRIGAKIELVSGSEGTTVRLSWKDTR
jgi:signal transduction histidine kinase